MSNGGGDEVGWEAIDGKAIEDRVYRGVYLARVWVLGVVPGD